MALRKFLGGTTKRIEIDCGIIAGKRFDDAIGLYSPETFSIRQDECRGSHYKRHGAGRANRHWYLFWELEQLDCIHHHRGQG
jgi:hypothetical protein